MSKSKKTPGKKRKKDSLYAFSIGRKADGTYYLIKPDATPAGTVDAVTNAELAHCFEAFEQIITSVVMKKKHMGTGSGVHLEVADVPPP